MKATVNSRTEYFLSRCQQSYILRLGILRNGESDYFCDFYAFFKTRGCGRHYIFMKRVPASKRLANPFHRTGMGKPVYYHGPHELWKIVGGAAKINQFCLKFLFILQSRIRRKTVIRQRERHFLTYCFRVCFSWSFVLTRCRVLTLVTKILMRAILIFTLASGSPQPCHRRMSAKD